MLMKQHMIIIRVLTDIAPSKRLLFTTGMQILFVINRIKL